MAKVLLVSILMSLCLVSSQPDIHALLPQVIITFTILSGLMRLVTKEIQHYPCWNYHALLTCG